MVGKVAKLVLAALPQNQISRLAGKMARSKFSKKLVKGYASHFKIDVTEAEKNIEEYEHVTDFFTRKLKKGMRKVDSSPRTIVSPVDGTISEFGSIHNDTLIQAKGIDYRVTQLVGNSKMAERFKDGMFITIYLSPSDYHRIHTPLAGKGVSYSYIPGRLFPVNQIGVKNVKGLFARNERLITYLETEAGLVAMVKVGAFIVGSVKVNYHNEVTTNPSHGIPISREITPVPSYAKGDEIGWFEFGSTVILLFEKDKMNLLPGLVAGQKVRMGEGIGTI
ncbi:MAG TPA: phosphatidylserine decarboxylase [Paenibacillaceae bacterium]|nr:phosphatidylserine decarboxylase [Paenibacillaceae bacterium]